MTNCDLQLQTGKYPGLGWIFWSSRVQMKEEDVYFHWFQAQYVKLLVPELWGQVPHKHGGWFCAIKQCGAPRGPKKTYIFDKIDKNNDNNQAWDGLFDLKCTQKKLFDLNTCLFTQYIYVFMFKKCLWVHIYHICDLWWPNFKRENILYFVEYFGHVGCKWKRKMYIFIDSKLTM